MIDGRTYTTRELSIMYGVTIQTVSRWIRRYCEYRQIDVATFGLTDPTDARVRRFSESDIQLLQNYLSGDAARALDLEQGFSASKSDRIDELEAQVKDLKLCVDKLQSALSALLSASALADLESVRAASSRVTARGLQNSPDADRLTAIFSRFLL